MGKSLSVDMRNPKKRVVSLRDWVKFYGLRPKHKDVWYLSAYEFLLYWTPALLSYPLSLKSLESGTHHVKMTKAGMRVLKAAKGRSVMSLQPGFDYVVKDGDLDWLPYPDTESCAEIRHTWILVRNNRPKLPTCFWMPCTET